MNREFVQTRPGHAAAHFLIFVACFQFLCAATHIQETALYYVINPYVTLAPFLFIWLAALGFYGHAADKNFTIALVLVLGLQLLLLGAIAHADDAVFLYLRDLQFFWGPALLMPIFLGLFRLLGPADPTRTAQRFIKGLCIIGAGISLFEIVVVRLMHMPATTLPWIDEPYPGIHRPFGLPDYPQPNAVILALLFWLSFLYRVPGQLHRLLVAFTLALTYSGTGVLIFLGLIPLWTRRPFLFSGLGVGALGALVAFATSAHQYSHDTWFEKFDLAYSARLLTIFTKVLTAYLSQFSANGLAFGSSNVTLKAVIGLTHDWAYFDVFYVHGLVGMCAYIFLYGVVLYLACPLDSNRSMRWYFVVIVLLANFHYGTLNYYVGQMLFSILAALNLYARYGRWPVLTRGRAPAVLGMPVH